MKVEEAKQILNDHSKAATPGTREKCGVCLTDWPCVPRWQAAFVMADYLARNEEQ